MVGSSIVRELKSRGYSNLILRTSKELNLRNQVEVNAFFDQEKPQFVFLAAAKVGGIMANNVYRADFLYQNIMIQSNVIHAAYINQAEKLLFLGSSCIYPKLAPQPLAEDSLLSGPLEPTNEPYAIAKIAGIKMCDAYRAQYNCNFISAMPTNLYGPNDNYDLETSHVMPALIRKFIEAKNQKSPSVTLWGTGKPKREFLHVDDLAKACLFMMDNFNQPGPLNIGTGEDVSILQLAEIIKEIVEYKGKIEHDLSKPDGTPRKLMNVSKINDAGWKYKIPIHDGIQSVINDLDTSLFDN
ncbi:UNVERIFIED_CONTAM: hypothetical protein GTU68_039642 [Idotea baltica]|nr:hypothetical protein [Idotea baltica]